MLVLFSCGGSSSSPGGAATDSSTDSVIESSPDLNKIAGLWDASYKDEEDKDNIFYVEFISQGITSGALPGSMYDWDYMIDDFGTGEDCYVSANYSIVALGNNLYRIRQETFQITIDGPLMTIVNQVDGADPVTYRRIEGFSSTDFIQC